MNLIAVDNVYKYFHIIDDGIKKALDKTYASETFPLNWIFSNLLTGKMQLWIGDQFFIITDIDTFPNGEKYMDIFIVYGDNMPEWYEDAFNVLVKFSRTINISKIKASGRKGWFKYAKMENYKPTQEQIFVIYDIKEQEDGKIKK